MIKKIVLIHLTLLILVFSCVTNNEVSRKPSSLPLKYPEFSLERKLIVNEKGCLSVEGEELTHKDYQFDEFKKETSITYYASRKVLRSKYLKIYNSEKRLRNRMYLKGGEFSLPHNGLDVTVKRNFLNTVAHQVEFAYQMNVVENLYYPDMGHMHLYLPENKVNIEMESALADAQLKVIYHTAEQLMMKSGPSVRDTLAYRQFRYRTRNLVGSFDGKGILEVSYAHNNPKFNTLKEIPAYPNYHDYNSTLYISANKDGCIGYYVDGCLLYFDLSFSH